MFETLASAHVPSLNLSAASSIATHLTASLVCCRSLGSDRDMDTVTGADDPVFDDAPSTYYARWHRPPSARAQRDAVLTEEIAEVQATNYDAFGARKMHIVLNREPDTRGRGHVARCTIDRLMRELGLHGIRRAKAPTTTRSAPRDQSPEDLVNRHFSPSGSTGSTRSGPRAPLPVSPRQRSAPLIVRVRTSPTARPPDPSFTDN